MSETHNLEAGRSGMGSGRHEELRVPKTFGVEETVRDRAGEFAMVLGYTSDRIEDIKTAVCEACLNAIEHTTVNEPDDTVLVRFDQRQEGMEVAVSAKGSEFSLNTGKPDMNAKIEGKDRPRGWGLYLMAQLADSITLNSDLGITTITMKFLAKRKNNSN